jgi:hypothetical protein
LPEVNETGPAEPVAVLRAEVSAAVTPAHSGKEAMMPSTRPALTPSALQPVGKLSTVMRASPARPSSGPAGTPATVVDVLASSSSELNSPQPLARRASAASAATSRTVVGRRCRCGVEGTGRGVDAAVGSESIGSA